MALSTEVFIQNMDKRLDGEESLFEAGIRFVVTEGEYPCGKSYSMLIKNNSGKKLHIDRAGAVIRTDCRSRTRKWRVFLDMGSCGWCGVKRLDALQPAGYMQPVREQRLNDDTAAPPAFHRSDMQTALWDSVSGEALLTGFLRQRYGDNKIDIIPDSSVCDIDHLEAWQELGFDIEPGCCQPLDTFVIARGNNPYSLLEQFGNEVMMHSGKSFNHPPIVGMMTWYGYATAIDEDIILENARIIGELFGGYPQEMQNIMLLDHGWQEDANWGYWKPDAERFPHGMKWLSGQMNDFGVKMGLWYTPFCITENAPNYDELIPLMALDADGKPYTGAACVWGALPGHKSGNWTIRFFDGSRDEVQKKWMDELSEMKNWGTVYWKLDFFALHESYKHERSAGTGDLYAKTWENFRKAADGGHLAPCSCHTNLQAGYADSVRIASDIGCAGYWPGAMEHYRYGISTVIGLWYKNRNFWVNDADSIQIGRGCSLAEARVRATAVAFSGGHLMLSEDLRQVDNERIEMIRRLIPPCPKAARPLDMFENPLPEGYPCLWSLSLDTGLGPVTALAVFNLSSETKTYEIKPEMLGISPDTEYIALEWWQCKWLGRFKGAFSIDVPAEDAAVIHAGPVKDVPSVISVSHHITGGYILDNVGFDSSTGRLTGTILARPGLRMVLFGHLPQEWTFSLKSGYHSASNSFGGWQSEIVTDSTHTDFAVEFNRVEN